MISKELFEKIKAEAVSRGYRFETDADGTQRMIRPDGTAAVIARPPEPERKG